MSGKNVLKFWSRAPGYGVCLKIEFLKSKLNIVNLTRVQTTMTLSSLRRCYTQLICAFVVRVFKYRFSQESELFLLQGQVDIEMEPVYKCGLRKDSYVTLPVSVVLVR